MVDILSTCKVGHKIAVSLPQLRCSPSVVTIRSTVPQSSEIPDGLMNYSVERDVLTAAAVRITAFWNTSPCGLAVR
jgi:hypothetical protein